MKNTLFTEAIKVRDGELQNLSLHQKRIDEALKSVGGETSINLSKINIPTEHSQGMVKCRVVYSIDKVSVEFYPYTMRKINSLKLVYCNQIDYPHKYADRSLLTELLLQKEGYDDILIIRNGYVTDTSFSNVVFENETGLFTPSTYLLNGTKRQYLLQIGKMQTTDIKAEDIKHYNKIYLINAMIELEDNISIQTTEIY